MGKQTDAISPALGVKFDIWDYLADTWETRESWSDKPTEWITDELDEEIWSIQEQIILSVRDHRYTVVPSCHGVGKSRIASRAIAWWIESHPPGTAFAISTAPSMAQVGAVLWREVSALHTTAGLQGRITYGGYPKWYIGKELVGYGRKPADYDDTGFQGIHADFVLVVIDEAAGVTHQIFDAIDSLATNENARILAIGNPTDAGSHFANICRPNSGWNRIHIDGLRTPMMSYDNVVGPNPDKPKFPWLKRLMEIERIPYSTEQVSPTLQRALISPIWVEERIKRWGGCGTIDEDKYTEDELSVMAQKRCNNSAIFLCKVRGIFPTTSSTGVIPLGWVQLAIDRWNQWNDDGRPGQPGRRVVGVDVATGGDDESALAIRTGNVVELIKRFRTDDTVETAREASAYLAHPQALAVVDAIGSGTGVIGTLREWRREGKITSEVIGFNASAQSKRRDQSAEFRFQNDRSAGWWHLRELLDPAFGSKVMLPDDDNMIEELTAVRYETLLGGVIKVEKKEEIKKRIGRSTDTADAVIHTFWVEGLVINADDGLGQEWKEPRVGDGVIRYDGYSGIGERELNAYAGMNGDWSTMSEYGQFVTETNGWEL